MLVHGYGEQSNADENAGKGLVSDCNTVYGWHKWEAVYIS